VVHSTAAALINSKGTPKLIPVFPVTVKVKAVPLHATEALWLRAGIAPALS
jgi:hypothetical protein